MVRQPTALLWTSFFAGRYFFECIGMRVGCTSWELVVSELAFIKLRLVQLQSFGMFPFRSKTHAHLEWLHNILHVECVMNDLQYHVSSVFLYALVWMKKSQNSVLVSSNTFYQAKRIWVLFLLLLRVHIWLTILRQSVWYVARGSYRTQYVIPTSSYIAVPIIASRLALHQKNQGP